MLCQHYSSILAKQNLRTGKLMLMFKAQKGLHAIAGGFFSKQTFCSEGDTLQQGFSALQLRQLEFVHIFPIQWCQINHTNTSNKIIVRFYTWSNPSIYDIWTVWSVTLSTEIQQFKILWSNANMIKGTCSTHKVCWFEEYYLQLIKHHIHTRIYPHCQLLCCSLAK